MRYSVLATDYDGTIATHGVVDDATLDALRRVRDSGRKVLLVTGREIPDLFDTFAHPDVFDVIVAENGALLYYPSTKEERPLCDPPPEEFVQTLYARNVHPLSVGRVIVATVEPNETIVFETIHQLGIEQQVIFNKGAVMVLPSGVNKASGLKAALEELKIPCDHVVAVGDAENDHAFLQSAGFGAAVANALPSLKEHADYVCSIDHGAGVAELIDLMVTGKLDTMPKRRRTPVAQQQLSDVVGVHPNA